MAGIYLSNKRGFSFNEITIDNEKRNEICLLDVKLNATPSMSYFEINVPKRHGSIYYKNKYEDQNITVIIGLFIRNIKDRREIQRNILSKIIGVESKLRFLDEPDIFYNARFYDAIPISEDSVLTKLNINFIASYCKYGLEKSISLIPGVNKVNNAGNFRSESLIKITALANCESITINNTINSFTVQSLVTGDEAYIDSEKMIVYKLVNGIKTSMMIQFTGKFLTIAPGSNDITVTGTSYSANIELIFNDTYIV